MPLNGIRQWIRKTQEQSKLRYEQQSKNRARMTVEFTKRVNIEKRRQNILKQLLEACRERPVPRMERIQPLVREFPELVKAGGQGTDGDTCLNLVIYHKASIELILFLIESCPSAIFVPDKNDWLPLHTACRYYNLIGKHVLIKRLLHEYPTSISRPNSKGWYPLHLACYSTCTITTTTTTTTNQDYQQQQQQQADCWGILLEVIQTLVQLFPLAVQHPTPDGGWLPLHYACRYGAPLPIIKCLVDSYPESVRISNASKGLLPFHYACSSQSSSSSSLQVVQYLFEQYPDAILATPTPTLTTTTNNNNNNRRRQQQQLPIHMAFANHASQEVIEFLIHSTLEVVHTKMNTNHPNSSDVSIMMVDNNISRSLEAMQAFRRILVGPAGPTAAAAAVDRDTTTTSLQEHEDDGNDDNNDDDECCICLEPLHPTTTKITNHQDLLPQQQETSPSSSSLLSVQKVACGHSFHSKCLLQLIGREWTTTTQSHHSTDHTTTTRCPLCREAIVTTTTAHHPTTRR